MGQQIDSPEYQAVAQAAADFVRGARESRGWTQAKLAWMVDCKQSDISRLESGKRVPTLLTLWRIARATGHELELKLKED